MKYNKCSYISCKKKINNLQLITNKCKCNKYYCNIHRLPETHDCCYNYIDDVDKEKFIFDNKCVKQKINKI